MKKSLTIIILISLLSIILYGCKSPQIEAHEELKVTETEQEKTVETDMVETEPEEEILSEFELLLTGIDDEELRSNIENILQHQSFNTDNEKVSYINEVLNLKENNAPIEYLFNDLLEQYSPQEKLYLVNAFLELEFDEIIIKALLENLDEAENKIDADEDGYSNFNEITGLDDEYTPLPFEENGESIIYINENDVEIHRSHSNPLDPKDTPEHMATYDFSTNLYY